ncbi:MAG: transcriptional regulator [Flavobacteriales bacterium]|jgi:DNA-binding transcriptional ArsR family regulator|nr:transcriptional regulator [Flavobacteriales bacterium]|tara:strand:+ start:29 stop:313 length:285 start_codon:yes stop_codon:yes gene_type:complete
MINQSNSISKTASLLKSLGHPIRLRIIIALSRNTSMTVTDIIYDLSIDQPIISLHLSILRKNNVIKVKKEGKKSFYSIHDKSVKQIVNIAYHSR